LKLKSFSELSIYKRILKKISVATKILSSTTVFTIDNKKYFLSTKSTY